MRLETAAVQVRRAWSWCVLGYCVLCVGAAASASHLKTLTHNTVLNRQIEVSHPGLVVGTKGSSGSYAEARTRTVLNCAGGQSAFLVKQTSLVLQNTVLVNCSGQAIVLVGPGASLTANNVTFSGHGNINSTSPGIVISARQAIVRLTDVAVVNNNGATGAAMPGSAAFQPPCKDGQGMPAPGAAVCGPTKLLSSLIDLQDSTLVAANMQASSNTAAALISSTGAAPNKLQLFQGTRLHNNTVSWLVVADSFEADATGRRNQLAPQPSERIPSTIQGARYTAHTFIGRLRKLSLQQLESEAKQPSVLRFIGKAPRGQAPLLVQLQDAALTGNTVFGGLMWLRLVNTTMTHVNITRNAAPIRALQGTAQATQGPPDICDMEAQNRALVQVHGPSAFDVFMSDISSNVHPSGAIIRVTDGLGLTSLRSTVLRNNRATAVLRFEGRTWVLNTDKFFNSTRALDVDLYRQAEGTSENAFRSHLLPDHKAQQDIKDNSITDAAWLMLNCNITNNTVFHAVILSKGQRLDWRKFESARAEAVEKAKSYNVEKDVTLDTHSANGWMTDCILSGNRFMPGSVIGTFLPEGSSYVDALSIALSAFLEDRAEWAQNHSHGACQAAVLQGIKDSSSRKYYIRPAVLTSTFSINFFWGSFLENDGFHNAVSLHSTLTTASLQLHRNAVDSSLVRMVDSDIKICSSQLLGNRVASGSLMESDTLVGNFSQITLANNRGSSPAEGPAEGKRNTNSTNIQAPGSSSDPAGSPDASTSNLLPIWGLKRLLLGQLDGITITGNKGPAWGFAMDFSDFNLLSPLSNSAVTSNEASGIRLTSTLPWFDGQEVALVNVTVEGNKVTSEAGGLAIGGFESKIGKTMSVRVVDCLFANNTPAAGRTAGLVRGGGMHLMAPAEDSADSSNTPGLLEKLTVNIMNTVIQGNQADEGGGLWSAWPTNIINCTIQNNKASLAGGGLFLRGLQQYKLGSSGYTNMSNSQLRNNAAGFGGGLACDNCRAIFYLSDITDNSATDKLRELFEAPTDFNSSSSTIGSSTTSQAASADSHRLATCTADRTGQATPSTSNGLMQDAVPGAGGAIAARLGSGNSYVMVCGQSHGPHPARLANNSASKVGGLVFARYGSSSCGTGCPTSNWSPCTGDAIQPASAEVLATRQLCGIKLFDVDVSGNQADFHGHLLAWTGHSDRTFGPAFKIVCTSTKTGHSNSSSDRTCRCGKDFETRATPRGHAAAHQLFWQLPSQLAVFNTSCLQWSRSDHVSMSRSQAVGQRECEIMTSSTVTAVRAKVYAGEAMNFTVRLGQLGEWGPAAAGANSSSSPANSRNTLGAILLRQSSDGELFVIGKSSAKVDSTGAATFSNMSLQPVEPPLYNRNLSFSFAPRTCASSDGLLRMVEPVEVMVQLLRCTLGQFMMINRCVPCADSGTFSLHPSQRCQPCVPGGTCLNGLLQPQIGYWMHSPFVPQVLPCPLEGACANRPIRMQNLRAMATWAAGPEKPQEGHNSNLLRPFRDLLQLPDSPERSRSSSSESGSGDGEAELDRNAALLQYNRWMAQLITHDPTKGPFMLLDNGIRNVSYRELLDGFHKIQCSPGYTGMMCGSCDADYEELSSDGSTVKKRFALSGKKCVDCSRSPATTAFVLFLLFLFFFSYVGLGIYGQVKAEHASLTSLAQQEASADASQQKMQLSTSSAASITSSTVYHNGDDDGDSDDDCNTADQDSHKHLSQQCDQQHKALQSSTSVMMQPYQHSDCDQPDTQQTSHLQQPVPVVGPPSVACPPAQSSDRQEYAAPANTTKQQGSDMSQGKAGAMRPTTFAVFVAMWKVMTSFLQVLAMVRFLPAIRELSGQILSIADFSTSFTQFAAFDCILPGPADKLAYTRILLAAFGVPVLLFLGFVLVWTVAWAVHRAGAGLHQQLKDLPSTSKASAPWTDRSSNSLPNSCSTATPATEARGVDSTSGAAAVAAAASDGSATSKAALPPVGRLPNSATINRGGSGLRSKSFASFVFISLPSTTAASLERLGVSQPPPKLGRYLPLRLRISMVVLAYSCYPLFTSNMLHILACQPIDGALSGGWFGGGGGAQLVENYGTLHHQWLKQRYEQRPVADEDPQLCHPGSAQQTKGNICQVTGLYWKQDYSVQCFHGVHAALVGFGAVMLGFVGMVLPLVLGVQLWHNRDGLREPGFALKYSFLYREYKDHLCFWEFVIMARKLVFLGIFVALTPPDLLTAEFVALLQLVVVVMVAVIALLVQEVLQPFKDQRLNMLERAALMSNIMTFLMLAAAVAINGNRMGRVVLLALSGALNLAVLCYFFWHMGKVIWAIVGPDLKSMLQCHRKAWGKQWQAWKHKVMKSEVGQADAVELACSSCRPEASRLDEASGGGRCE